MRILITRNKNSNSQDAESYMRVVFANLKYKICIESVKLINDSMVSASAGKELIEVRCNPQGTNLEGYGLAREVEDELSARKDLRLEKLIFFETKQDQAIKRLIDDTYKVDLFFAKRIATDDKYREELQTKDVKAVWIEYKDTGYNKFRSTGKMTTSTPYEAKEIEFDLTNPYHCFAAAVSENSELRQQLSEDMIHELSFSKAKDGKLKFNIAPQKNLEDTLLKRSTTQPVSLGNNNIGTTFGGLPTSATSGASLSSSPAVTSISGGPK